MKKLCLLICLLMSLQLASPCEVQADDTSPQHRNRVIKKKKVKKGKRVLRQQHRQARRPVSSPPQTSDNGSGNGNLTVWAQSALLLDMSKGTILYQKDPEVQRSIASLTKLMTALVFLEDKPDLERTETVLPEDIRESGRSRFVTNETVTRYDLLYASLVSSDNVATKAIVRASGLSTEAFVERMNERAESIGLKHTRFVEVTGLDSRNVSTALDCARLLSVAMRNRLITTVMRTKEYIFATDRRRHRLLTTNRLLRTGQWQILGGKTGFINKAGYCFATSVSVNGGREMLGVILGAGSNGRRFTEMQKMLTWGLQNMGK
ncbi:MAG: D-alanyl-D-alanine carboxypeptidase [Candidatus Latescibacteria bacterium]|nr:D-alanyl-D-alanine carboxypeptidase [Candidatus Latescibacterota bacterium]